MSLSTIFMVWSVDCTMFLSLFPPREGRGKGRSRWGVSRRYLLPGVLFGNVFVLFENFLTEVGVHLFIPFLLAGDLGVVDIADLDVIKGADACRKLNRFFCSGTRRSLDLVLGCNGVEAVI